MQSRFRSASIFLFAASLTAIGIAPPCARAAEAEAEISAECGEIVLAEFSWATAGLSSRLLELVLSDGYGCEAARRPAAPKRVAEAIAEADRQMRAAEAKAAPLGAAPIDGPAAVIAVGAQREGRRSTGSPGAGVAVGAELYGGLDRGGWFAPSWLTASNPKLRRIEDIVDQADVFAHSATAKPKLHVCPKDWACHQDDLALIAMLGLEEHFDIVVPASGDALTASMIEAWRYRRPWLGSYWTPSTAVAEFSMTRLESGALEICRTAKSSSTTQSEGCRPPHRAAPRVTLYPQALEQRAPRVASMLRRFALPPEVALEALAWRAANNADLDDAALQLLDTRPSLWRTWLDEPARRRFEVALAERLQAADARLAQEKSEREADGPKASGPQTGVLTDEEGRSPRPQG